MIIKILELKLGRDCKAKCYLKALNDERNLPSYQMCLWSSWQREGEIAQSSISVPLRNRFIHTILTSSYLWVTFYNQWSTIDQQRYSFGKQNIQRKSQGHEVLKGFGCQPSS